MALMFLILSYCKMSQPLFSVDSINHHASCFNSYMSNIFYLHPIFIWLVADKNSCCEKNCKHKFSKRANICIITFSVKSNIFIRYQDKIAIFNHVKLMQ